MQSVPCDGCEHRPHCAATGNACRAFAAFTGGSNWRAQRREPESRYAVSAVRTHAEPRSSEPTTPDSTPSSVKLSEREREREQWFASLADVRRRFRERRAEIEREVDREWRAHVAECERLAADSMVDDLTLP